MFRIILLGCLFYSFQSHGASFERAGFQITVEPVLGYEFTQVKTPVLHTRGMLVYGGRFTAGHRLISAEGEFTTGTVNETFPSVDQNLKTEKQNVRLGIRSVQSVSSLLDVLVRMGGQATRTRVDATTLSTATTLTDKGQWLIHPYAGAGLQASLFGAFSLSFDATYLFRSVSDWSQNDVQTSLALKFHLPTK